MARTSHASEPMVQHEPNSLAIVPNFDLARPHDVRRKITAIRAPDTQKEAQRCRLICGVDGGIKARSMVIAKVIPTPWTCS
jgi:hypothetical protein